MHEALIKKSIALAQQARDKGNHPFGALLVKNGEVILTAENTVHSDQDPTRHAELNLVSRASQQFDPQILEGTILYTSTEPCVMCAGAIYWVGVRQVVFGCSNQALGDLAGLGLGLTCRQVFAQGTQSTEVTGPVLEQEALTVHQGYWSEGMR